MRTAGTAPRVEVAPLEIADAPDTSGDLRRIGRDELNLTEFPFALLATRSSRSSPHAMEFKDGEKEWVVKGDPDYGLPNSTDVQVYVVLMEMTREQDFPVVVEFSRYEVLRRLGWNTSGASYERLNLSLDRLVSVTIRTKNAFFDARQRKWITKEAFHILESYKLADLDRAQADELALMPSWIRWSPEIYANIQAGFMKALDVDLFLSLKSAIAQALYRYLDAKRYDGKPLYRIGIRKLAWEHLGLSRNYYPSDIKRKLDPAHGELIDCGFLAGAEYAPMKSGEDMVVYRFAPKAERLQPVRASSPTAASPAPSLPTSQPDDLARRLMEAGVSRQSALELAAGGREECERQLDYLCYREARDPGAVLVKSIREGWAAPTAWAQAQEQERKRARAEKKRVEAVAQAEAKTQAESGFDEWWAGQDAASRGEVEVAALLELRKENRVLADFASKHPDSPIFREALRPYLKRLSGWPAASQG